MYEARLKIEFSKVDDKNYQQFLSEYNGLNYHQSLRDFKFRAMKLDFTKEEALLFDMLCDIKMDLLELKDLRAQDFIELEQAAFSAKIGYEGFCLEAPNLETNAEYYARMVLESSTIAVFFKAIDAVTAQISKIKRSDEESLNHFVADTQRNLIYQKKEKENATRFDN